MEAGVNLGSEVRKAVEGAAMPRRKRGSARVHAALGAGIVLMIACVSVAIFYLRSREAIAGLVHEFKSNRSAAMAAALASIGEHSITLATDYSIWDEAWDFIERPDPEWAADNLAHLDDELQFDYVALLNREGDYVYQDGLLASFPDWRRQDLLQPVLDQLQQQPEVQFIAYLPENGKLHWITGARVVHSEDSARTGPYNGYFIVGDTMEDSDLAHLEAVTGVRGLKVHLGDPGVEEAMLQDTLVLEDYIGPQSVVLRYDNYLPLAEHQLSRWRYLSRLSIGAIVLAILTTFVICHVVFVAPFLKLSGAIARFARTGQWKAPTLRFSEFETVATALTSAIESSAEAQAQLVAERDHLDQRVKERTEELARSEQRYRAIIEDLPVLICRFGPGRRITFVSQNYCTYFGRTEEEILGTDFLEFVPPEDHQTVVDHLATLGPNRAVATFEHRVVAGDGSVRWHRWSDRVILGDDGEILGYQSVGQDITETRLLESQLQQAQKMEVVGRLAGGVAHDLNNLLTVIGSNAGFALDGIGRNADEAREDLQEVLKAAERAKNLTQQLLAFSRRQIITPEILDLNTLILDMDKMLRRLIGEDIELVTIPAENLGLVRADRGQMAQVILNLAVNARDAMDSNGILTIETARAHLDKSDTLKDRDVIPGEYVMLAVSDNGVGMSDEVKAHLFEPFFTTKELGKGTGLGLATVYGIVKQHNGHIWVYSELGKGTTVKIYLPLVEEDVPIEPRTEKKELKPTEGKVVLVAEDEPAVRSVTVRMLQRLGYRVMVASNGDEALRIADQYVGPIHLLLTDVVMPHMSGRELAEALRRRQPAVKVLYVSGYTDNDIHHHGVLDESVEFLPKPFTSEVLARRVQEVLGEAAG